MCRCALGAADRQGFGSVLKRHVGTAKRVSRCKDRQLKEQKVADQINMYNVCYTVSDKNEVGQIYPIRRVP